MNETGKEKELKLTDLDYAVGSHRLQMLKAALPYMEIPQQKAMSMFIKWNELMRTMEFFDENDDGMLSVCSLDASHTSPADMLSAVKPYANEREQEVIDLMARIYQARSMQNSGGSGRPGANSGGNSAANTSADPGARTPFGLSAEQLLMILPPEQRSRFESIRMILQGMSQPQMQPQPAPMAQPQAG